LVLRPPDAGKRIGAGIAHVTEEDWRQAWEIFRAAEEFPAGERRAFVESAGADPHVSEEVLTILSEQAPEQSSPEPGSQYGRYTIVEFLGSGGTGQVYSARDSELGRLVAMKFLTAKARLLPTAIDRLVREAQAASSLNHPNLVTVYEVLHSEDSVALVTELIEGQPLRAFCGEAQPAERVAAWGAQVARGLAAAHARGIVHGDIKPENVMLRGDGFLKVLDFGVARQAGALGSWDTIPLGTFGYMSPEQTHGALMTSASDIFSLGVVLLELATGKHPFLEATAVATTLAINQRTATLPTPANARSAHRTLAPILEAMLEKDGSRRPTAANLVTLFESAGAISRPRRVPTWVSIATAACLALACAAWLWLRPTRGAIRLGNAVPITTYAGLESQPTLSPDGTRLAFVWSGLDDNNDIYVRSLARDDLRRITTDPREETSPAWSPDGKWIAYVRRASDGGDADVLVVPADGGPERLAGRVVDVQSYRGVAWWPDSGSLILRDASSHGRPLFRLFLDGGKQRLTADIDAQDFAPAVSTDGSTLAFVRVQSAATRVCRLPLAGGSERCVPWQRRSRSIAWLGDSRTLLIGDSLGLWQLPAQGPPTRLLDGAHGDVTVNRAGNLLVFGNGLIDTNIWRLDIDTGHTSKFIASSEEDSEPDFSPDGRQIVFRSGRTGKIELYVCDSDARNLRQLTTWNGEAGSARWSPDGRWIAFGGGGLEAGHGARTVNTNIYVVPASGGALRRLTDDRVESEVPNWSRDSRWIYYTTEPGSARETWKAPLDGGAPERVNGLEMFDLMESGDGASFYYTRPRARASGVWRRAKSGGPERMVPGTEALVYRSWDLRGDRLFFLRDKPDAGFAVQDLLRGAVRKLGDPPKLIFNGPRILAASPDGKTILYTQLDLTLGDLYRTDILSTPGANKR
jgi:serine/threonine protein kinase